MSRLNKEHQKALKQKYRETKPLMGVVMIKNKVSGQVYIAASKNIRGTFNRDRFTLNLGTHLNKQLQSDWNALGEAAFSFAVLETLDYDENTNIEEELELLEMICREKLERQDIKFY